MRPARALSRRVLSPSDVAAHGITDLGAVPGRVVRGYLEGLQQGMDPEQVREFAHGLSEIIVIEEKAQNLEWLVKDALYGRTDAPVVVGKRLPDGAPLFPPEIP